MASQAKPQKNPNNRGPGQRSLNVPLGLERKHRVMAQYLSVELDRHPYCHANATSHSLSRDDQFVPYNHLSALCPTFLAPQDYSEIELQNTNVPDKKKVPILIWQFSNMGGGSQHALVLCKPRPRRDPQATAILFVWSLFVQVQSNVCRAAVWFV